MRRSESVFNINKEMSRQLLEEVNTRERNTAEKVSVFGVILIRISRIRTEYEEIPRISLYSVQMRENTDQNNSEYRHFLRSVKNVENAHFRYFNPGFNQIDIT